MIFIYLIFWWINFFLVVLITTISIQIFDFKISDNAGRLTFLKWFSFRLSEIFELKKFEKKNYFWSSKIKVSCCGLGACCSSIGKQVRLKSLLIFENMYRFGVWYTTIFWSNIFFYFLRVWEIYFVVFGLLWTMYGLLRLRLLWWIGPARNYWRSPC